MEPFDDPELTDDELNRILRQWEAPSPPAGLRAAIFPEKAARWWRRSIRMPLPVAACVAILLIAGAWRWVVPDERVVQLVYRNQPAQVLTFRELQPVTELRPRIIRRGHAAN